MTKKGWYIASGFLISAILGLLSWLGRDAKDPALERLGEINVWPAAAESGELARPLADIFPFDLTDQAEVLVSGLDDVRGLACSGNVIYITSGNGFVWTYAEPAQKDQKARGLEANLSPHKVLEDAPSRMDVRGAAMLGGSLLLADFDRGAVVVRPQPPGDAGETRASRGEFSGPAGVTVAPEGAIFVSDLLPWPAPGVEGSFEATDYARWVEKGIPRVFGTLFIGSRESAGSGYNWTRTPVRLTHPSGLAAVSKNGPVYVVESDQAEVRWRVVEFVDQRWQLRKTLGAAPIESRELSTFLGVALSPHGHFVFGAGPQGLYFFRADVDREAMLGRMTFEEPVSGVAACNESVYVAVGNRLCRIRLLPKNDPFTPAEPPSNNGVGARSALNGGVSKSRTTIPPAFDSGAYRPAKTVPTETASSTRPSGEGAATAAAPEAGIPSSTGGSRSPGKPPTGPHPPKRSTASAQRSLTNCPCASIGSPGPPIRNTSPPRAPEAP